MPFISSTNDLDNVTQTMVAEFPVPVARLWDAYADPRQLEKFWGPPQWPATFTRHDMHVGGESHYAMHGPNPEDVSRGYWEYLAVEPGRSFRVRDGFANPDGSRNTDMPTMEMEFRFEEIPGGSRLTVTTWFNSREELEHLLSMGMEEGGIAAMSQMDAVLAELTDYSATFATEAQLLDDTTVRVSRILRAPAETVWRAHQEAELMQQWLLGPEGWTMPRCEIAQRVGDSYVYEWAETEGEGRFGFTGELLESAAPYRAVTTERMLGTDGPSTLNELTLIPLEHGTLLTLLIRYPSREVRDMILGTGMTDGMESSYARLEQVAASA